MPDPTSKQQFYQSHLAAADAKGLSIAAYAKSHNINCQSLYNERARQRRAAADVSSAPFVRVTPRTSLPPELMAPLQVQLPNGVRISLPTDQMPMSELLTALACL